MNIALQIWTFAGFVGLFQLPLCHCWGKKNVWANIPSDFRSPLVLPRPWMDLRPQHPTANPGRKGTTPTTPSPKELGVRKLAMKRISIAPLQHILQTFLITCCLTKVWNLCEQNVWGTDEINESIETSAIAMLPQDILGCSSESNHHQQHAYIFGAANSFTFHKHRYITHKLRSDKAVKQSSPLCTDNAQIIHLP